MKKNSIYDFSLQTTDFSGLDSLPDLAIINEHFAMILNVGPVRKNFVTINQPYRLLEGRILWVTEGWADIELTMEAYHIEKGNILMVPPETIIELKRHSEDYNMIGIISKVSIPVNRNRVIHPTDGEWHETLRLANLLWDIAGQTPFRREMVDHLLAALISDIKDIGRAEQQQIQKKRMTRGEETFARFKKLVNEHCARHRNIAFYADELALTPHYLSSLIAKVSGQSVMYWINRATLLQAKVLLHDKDMLVCEVADRLNFPSQSAFGTFFKRETGMTPSEYQKRE